MPNEIEKGKDSDRKPENSVEPLTPENHPFSDLKSALATLVKLSSENSSVTHPNIPNVAEGVPKGEQKSATSPSDRWTKGPDNEPNQRRIGFHVIREDRANEAREITGPEYRELALDNAAIQQMNPTRHRAAVCAVLSYTYSEARQKYADLPANDFAKMHGEIARSLPAEEVLKALTMYSITGDVDLNSHVGRPVMAASAQLSENSGKDFGTAYKLISTEAPYVANELAYLPKERVQKITSLKDLSEQIVLKPGQSREAAMQEILNSTGSRLAGSTGLVGLYGSVDRRSTAAVADYIQTNTVEGNGIQRLNAIKVAQANLNTPDAPHTQQAMEAMNAYVTNGGEFAKLDAPHIVMAVKLYSEFGAQAVKPYNVEVAMNLGPAALKSPLNAKQLESAAQAFAQGKVTDFRLAPVVAELVRNDVPVTRQNIEALGSATAANGGQLKADQLRAVMSVGETVRQVSSWLPVLETFARAHAADLNIRHRSMPLSEVLSELSNVELAGQKLTPENIAKEINQLQRLGGGFADHQLQDPATVKLLLEHGNDHPFAPQAINAITRTVGAVEARRHPEYIAVLEEYLENGGRLRDINLPTLNTALALGETRYAAMLGADLNSDWKKVRISPETVKLVQRDSKYSLSDSSINSQELIDKVLKYSSRADSGKSPERQTNATPSIGEVLYESVPATIKTDLPSGFNHDVMDALSEALEANRGNWSSERSAAVEQLLEQYGAGQAEAVAAVNSELSQASESHRQSAGERSSISRNEAPGLGRANLEIVAGASSSASIGESRHGSAPGVERFSTAALTKMNPIPFLSIETFTSPEGLKLINSIPSGQLTVAAVIDRMNGIDKEIAQADARGNADYARQLESVKNEYQSKSPAEREAFCRQIHERATATHQASHAGSGSVLRGISGKAGTAGAVLMISNFVLQMSAPNQQVRTDGGRVVPSRK